MRVSKYIHSCLLIENKTGKILFDPGKFTFAENLVKPSQFENLSAIILTHFHPDHIDEEALKEIIENNSSAVLFGNTEIKNKLAEKEIICEVFETGTRQIDLFSVEAFDATHAAILGSEPPQNTAYLIDETLLVPGDSFAETLETKKNTKFLALPVMAPWTTELEVAAFARRMNPQQIIPIHDGYAKDFFLKSRYENFQKHFSKANIKFQWMSEPGDFFETENLYY
jgi:L-ascorbate metabolism protein UlaG (beta-lactamase superfamily)